MSDGRTQEEDRSNAFIQFYRWVFCIGYERNIGGPERTIRYTSGAVLVLAGIGIGLFPILGDVLINVVIAILLIVAGLYLNYEAQVQSCPLNDTFDRSTYPAE